MLPFFVALVLLFIPFSVAFSYLQQYWILVNRPIHHYLLAFIIRVFAVAEPTSAD